MWIDSVPCKTDMWSCFCGTKPGSENFVIFCGLGHNKFKHESVNNSCWHDVDDDDDFKWVPDNISITWKKKKKVIY